MMRRVLMQVAYAAVRTKGSIFQSLFQRLRTRLGPFKAMWAICHRICRLTWKILHQGIEYIEFGQGRDPKKEQHRINRIIRSLRSLGYQVIPPVKTDLIQDSE